MVKREEMYQPREVKTLGTTDPIDIVGVDYLRQISAALTGIWELLEYHTAMFYLRSQCPVCAVYIATTDDYCRGCGHKLKEDEHA